MAQGAPQDASSALEAVYRSDWGRVVAALIGLFGDFDGAEEAAQDAFAAAADQWSSSGVPEFPRAWLIQTSRHKAIDRIRRKDRVRAKFATYLIPPPRYASGPPHYENGYIAA